MINDIDIYRTAKLIIDQYGETALAEAKDRARNFAVAGDPDASVVWTKIAKAVEWMQTPTSSSEPLH